MKRKVKWGGRLLASFVCSLFLMSMHAQVSVTGTVLDTQNEPLVGASVAVKGTTNGTITDIDGRFILKAPNGNVTFVFSFIGYDKQEIALKGRTTLKVILKENTKTIDEVVVVGYGTQKKSSLTGSVSQIRGDELLKAPSTNVSSLLGGRLPGIQSVQTSGQPGEDQAALTIRGSIYGVTYIVDGMPRSINDIDPNDIETVSVLKDGASAAVYGLQGAGGVVIITTKKGHEGKSQITYSGTYGISQNANFPKFLDGPGFAYYYNKGLEMDGNQPIFTQADITKMTNGDDSDGWGNTNWIKKVFGTGHNQQHSVTAQGGTDNIKYFTSLGYLGQEGNINNYTYDRYNLRANIDADIASNWKLTVGVAGQVGRKKNPAFSAGGSGEDTGENAGYWMSIAQQAIASHPYLPAEYNGLPVGTPNNGNQPNSPLAAINKSGKYKTNTLDLQSNVTLQYNVPWVKGLNVKFTGAYDFETSRNKNLTTPYYVMIAKKPDTTNPDISYQKVIDPRGTTYITLGEGDAEYTQLVGQGSINYVTTIAKKHHIDAMVLLELRDKKSNNFSAYGKDLNFVELPELNFAQAANSPIAGSSDHTRSAGYVFRAKYDYDNTYLAEFTGRYDGSYRFSGNVSGKRWGFFPSFSAGWRMSNEDFMKDLDFIDNLKLRASAGMLGNDGVPAYSFLSTYANSDAVVLGGTRLNSLATGVIANPNLTWERTLSYNAGFDLNMWKGLLGLEFDLFYNYTYDILTSMGSNYPSSMGGYYPTYENYNKIDGKGLEVLLSHKNHIGAGKHAFNYGASFNLTYAKSRWLRYPDSPNVPNYQKVTGQAYGAKMGWTAAGLFQSEEEIDNSPRIFGGDRARPGDIKYVDLNGDGNIGYEDRGYVGRSSRPELVGGLNLFGNWCGFDFNAQMVGGAICDVSLTGTYFNGYDDNTIFTQTFKEGGNSPRYLVENAWRPDNTGGTYPRLTVNDPHNNNGLGSTFWFRDGKYVRLKSVQIGYTFPQPIMNRMGINKLRVFVQGSNLLTLSGLPQGIDPESPGVNNGYYPQQRTFMTGITLTF
jgi:TonB-linked SusC/RagA family outer membrane protein